MFNSFPDSYGVKITLINAYRHSKFHVHSHNTDLRLV